MEKLKISELSFAYPHSEKPVLKNINLSVNCGEFVLVCGKSGCGKSTLLRQLKPIISPHGKRMGEIFFDGNNIDKLDQRKQASEIGFVFQNPDSAIVCDKVWHEIAFGLESLGTDNTQIRAKVAEMSAFFGIEELLLRDVDSLSGGQKQLLNLASVMVLQPSLLILDEPTSRLDPIAAENFLQTISKINRELGTTVIMSEHRLEETFSMADEVVVLDNSEICALGTPKEIGYMLTKNNNDMSKALPTASRVFYAVGENEYEPPVTVREGRKWLMSKRVSKEWRQLFKEYDEKNKNVLEADGLWFRYEKNSPDVLKGFDLKLREGEIYSIVGCNGSGKTTALSVLAGLTTAYRGKVKILDNKKIVMLPQNPVSLFTEKSVLSDLKKLLDDKNSKDNEKLEQVIRFCKIENILNSHPYDLSGGEQQRAALAMVMLESPDIFLLDEPTKGMDACFKEKFGLLLRNICKNGASVIIISHDTEFCARYADRTGMMFCGRLTSEENSKKFFGRKTFYTTAACRMSHGILDDAVLDTDIIRALGGEYEEPEEEDLTDDFTVNKRETIMNKTQKNNKEITVKNVFFGCLFILLFAASMDWYIKTKSIYVAVINIIFLGLCLYNFIPRREFAAETNTKTVTKIGTKRVIAAAVVLLVMVPLTVLAGLYFFGDRKYYFISLLIIAETMIPVAFAYEQKKPKAREIVLISVLCATAVIGRAAFAALPQFKPSAAVVIITGVCFGGETGFLVGAMTAFVSNFIFGQGPWTPWQMFAFGIIGLISGLIFSKGIMRKTRMGLSLVGFLSVLVVYGGIMNFATAVMAQSKLTPGAFLSYVAAGIPFDIIHAVSTVFFLWFAAEPMCEKIERVKIKYGLTANDI